MKLSHADEERFWGKVEGRGSDGCWLWRGAKWREGYGVFWLGGKRWRAQRISYELATGDAAEGLFVIHSCDEPACVNPAHLRAGTPADNMRDKTLRRRQTRGIAVKTAKLNDDKVREIRRLKELGATLTQLSARFGVRPNMIWRIVHREAWKHVD